MSKPITVVDRLRARAANHLHLRVNLSDANARTASIILQHVADCLDEQPEPVVKPPVVRKLATEPTEGRVA